MSEVLSTETKFTPGPWKISGKEFHRSVVYTYNNNDGLGDRDGGVATMMTPCNHDKQQLANAALIAAAPDLYEALKLALAAWGLEKSEPGFSLSAIEKQMRAALLKAHGGSSNEGE